MTTTRLHEMRRPLRAETQNPLAAALDQVGDRWLLLVVDALAEGPQRFGELAGRLGAATNILAGRLRTLEVEGLVVATPYSRRPLRLTYSLSASGQELAATLIPLAAWGAARDGLATARFHDPCGSAVELRPWCPTCDRPTGPGESSGRFDL